MNILLLVLPFVIPLVFVSIFVLIYTLCPKHQNTLDRIMQYRGSIDETRLNQLEKEVKEMKDLLNKHIENT